MMSWLVLKSAHEWLVLKRPVTIIDQLTKENGLDEGLPGAQRKSLSCLGLTMAGYTDYSGAQRNS
jgi:hypothetical protein